MKVNTIGDLLEAMGRRRSAFERRFREKLKRTTGGCMVWEGVRTEKGYGRVRVTGSRSMFATHRVAYTLKFGDPGPKMVLHKCDNPACCNPSHLYAGDNSENQTDRHQRANGVERLIVMHADGTTSYRRRPKPGDHVH